MRKNSFYELTGRGRDQVSDPREPMGDPGLRHFDGPVASHYPILLEEDRDELSIVTHVGRPDDNVHELGEHELLVIVQGPHGYISSSWYGDHIEVPTWNFIVAHLSGVPEVLEPEENFEVLTRLVKHFEQNVVEPRLLDSSPRSPRMPAATVAARSGFDWSRRGSSPSGR